MFQPGRIRLKNFIIDEDLVLYRFADSSMTPVRSGPGNQGNASPSPDGAWMLYESSESGRSEVYIGPIDTPGPNVQVSFNGGHTPRLSRDGKRIFFIDRQDAMMAADIEKTPTGPRVSAPTKLFDFKAVATLTAWDIYDTLPQGGFIMVEPAAWEREPPVIHVVINWTEELHGQGR